jgi:hypothetical protein
MKKLLIVLGILLITIVAGSIYVIARLSGRQEDKTPGAQMDSEAIKAGKGLSSGKCSGTGPGSLTHLPMNFNDFSMIIPYGSVVGDHVTPIDHQYFPPTIFNSPLNTYDVYAMADARLTHIEGHTTNKEHPRYRMIFSMTCTFLYYYDLVTSLSPDLQAEYEKKKQGGEEGYAGVDIKIKAGQLIGKIGGQTLDFAVWDTTKPLPGFITPSNYEAENWKIYTADPLDYLTSEIKEMFIAKYVRTAEPISGKIDYDIDGRLIGNWFIEGADGYAGRPEDGRQNGHLSHLAIIPDNYDPTAFIVSIGNYQGKPTQFSVPRDSENPADVSLQSGLTKYELRHWTYVKADGGSWDRMSLTKGPKLINDKFPSDGCVLFQLLENRKLKMEAFPQKICSSVSGFTDKAVIYTR